MGRIRLLSRVKGWPLFACDEEFEFLRDGLLLTIVACSAKGTGLPVSGQIMTPKIVEL